MPNIAIALRDEISRLSKKVVRQQVDGLKATVLSQKAQLAALKKQVGQLEKELGQLRRQGGKRAAEEPVEQGAKVRFTAKGLKSLRAKLDLSAEEFGKLLGVGGQTIYNWESEKATPRRAQVPAIAALRKIGKKEVRARLAGGTEA